MSVKWMFFLWFELYFLVQIALSHANHSVGSKRPIKVKELVHLINAETADPPSEIFETVYITANFNETYSDYTSSTRGVVFQYNYTFTPNQTWAIRVFTNSIQGSKNFPVLFVVRQERGISSWQIPMIFKGYKSPNVSRTLCPFQNYPGSQKFEGPQNIYIDVTTQSASNMSFTLYSFEITEFVIRNDETTTTTITPSEPYFVQYKFNSKSDVVLIHVTSDDLNCAVISLQDIQCPVYDLDRNIEFSGFYQTMTTQAGVTVSSEDFPQGFYIVFVLKPNDQDCARIETIKPSSEITNRRKTINVRISPKISQSEYYVAVFGVFAIFALVYFLSIVIAVIFLIKELRNPSERSLLESQDVRRPLHSSHSTGYGTVSPSRTPFDSRLKDPLSSFDEASGSVDTPSADEGDGDSLDETDVDMLDDADQEKDVFRTKTFLFVADLARKKQKKLSKKSSLYSRNILVIAIFYGIPVVQLVYTYQKVLHETGNQDICYYNFLCAHPFKVFSDFNHVFSNSGYVLLGILFFFLVWRRDIMHKKAMKINPRLDKYFGIPRHNGLYYAMGIALIMEGILSACYHVCPNYSNFQFDTTFMYIIASLCMLKIYQSRHPDINANSHSSCMIFAGVVLVGVIGVFDGSPFFWVAFCALEALCCLLLSIQVYYMGRWRLNWGIFKRIYLTLRNDLCTHFTRPMYPDRLGLLLFANVVNWALLAYGLAVQLKDFGTFLLAIFIINLMLYICFYIIMKLRYKEKILPQPKLYILLSCLTWGAAMYFFLHKNVSWQQTPAQSREKNRPCIVLHFYDVHDIWHFLSSAALFFSFMVLLTLDDDLIYVPRERIPVF